ncbi:MAG: hypothetical protein R6U66_02150 [Bacteroidales bacterium]
MPRKAKHPAEPNHTHTHAGGTEYLDRKNEPYAGRHPIKTQR